MKKWFVVLILALFGLPAIGFADTGLDFKTKCAGCHGAGGNLLPKMARLLKADPMKLSLKASQLNQEEMTAVIEKGRNKMPAFEKELTPEQIKGLVDYIMAIRSKK
jgi:mono/diheme cytochrome c family protein